MLRREQHGPEEDEVTSASPRWKNREDAWCAAVVAALPSALTSLTRLEQQVLIGYYFDERSIDDLAQTLRMHPERVCATLQMGMRELRRRLDA